MIGERSAVLLVDDRPENLLALRATLEPLDCRLVSVNSGESALKALLQHEFAVVLLDVQMPGMDGFETAELIKGRERTRAVPIIFVTAISKEPHHVYRGYSAGAVDYLFKPFDPELLKSKVQVFLDLDERKRAAARSEALLRAAFSYAPIGMARLDVEGRFAEVNRAFATLLGREPAELGDRLLEAVVHEDDLPDAARRRALYAGGLEGDEYEARLMPAAGDPIPCLLTFSVAHPGHGLNDAVILQVQDLRARRHAELEREQRVRAQVARTEAERAAESLRALQAISDAAMAATALDELIGGLLHRTADALGADTAAVVLSQPDGTRVVHQVAGGKVGDGERRWYSVVAAHDRGDPDLPPLGERIASTLTAPLAIGGTLLGLVHVGTLFERDFTGADAGLLRLVADRTAVAIQRARARQRDRAITEELQRSLLPAVLPDVPDTETASRYFPGDAGGRVGGDWYDAVPQPGGRLLLVIGDVAGHGIGAAAAMGQLRSALRAYALDGYGPAALLERMNAFQIGMRVPGMTTVGLVSVELAEQRVVYANAGHLPALLVPGGAGDDASIWLDGALGPPLGAVDDVTYREGEAPLVPGSTLVLYTDGLVEQRGEPLDAGLERLRAALRSAPQDIDGVCERILERTSPGYADDDVTLLVLRTSGDRRRARRRRRDAEDPAVTEEIATGARLLAAGRWGHRTSLSARVELPRNPRAGGAVRRIVRETLEGAVTDAEQANLHAVVSEVVNNAVVHAEGDEGHVVVHLAVSADALRAEITNDGTGFVAPEPSAVDEPGGFGLVIVEELTSRWGLDFEDGVCVWFEIDRAAPG